MDITVHSVRRAVDYNISNRRRLAFAVIGEAGAQVITPKPSSGSVSVSGGFSTTTIAISNAGEGDIYGPPYFTINNDDYRFFSWKRISGAGWLARRIHTETFVQDEIETSADAQPQTLEQFEGLNW